jgi:hypothetical protein
MLKMSTFGFYTDSCPFHNRKSNEKKNIPVTDAFDRNDNATNLALTYVHLALITRYFKSPFSDTRKSRELKSGRRLKLESTKST